MKAGRPTRKANASVNSPVARILTMHHAGLADRACAGAGIERAKRGDQAVNICNCVCR